MGRARMTAVISDTDPGFRRLRSRFVGQPTFTDVGLFPEDGFDIILKAAASEFGVPGENIPERSFLRATIDQNRNEIIKFINSIKEDIVIGRISMAKALDMVGRLVAKKVKETIFNKIPPPNAPLTIAKKGFDHPLIEEGEMLATIKHRVGRQL